MIRAHRWTVALIPLALVGGFAFAGTDETPPATASATADPLPLNPDLPFALNGCASTRERHDYEERDCLQSVRRQLVEGTIGLTRALYELEACATRHRPDLEEAGHDRLAARAAELRARLAFGEELTRGERLEYEEAMRRLEWEESPPSADDFGRLRRAGVTSAGFSSTSAEDFLTRYAADPHLRAAFRRVFGDRSASDLDLITAKDHGRIPAALTIGSTVLVPNFPLAPLEIAAGRELSAAARVGERVSSPSIVSRDVYERRILSELRALEIARARYLEAAAAANHRRGSVDGFLSRLRRSTEAALQMDSLQTAVEMREVEMRRRLEALERRLGVDPLLVRAAGESVGLVAHLQEECVVSADRRGRWVRAGAGIVTGLVGAAGVVIATGATGTIAGGVTIAAALEASLGAYLIARGERLRAPTAAAIERRPTLPLEAEERTFRRPHAQGDFETGQEGTGTDTFEEWFEDVGVPLDRAYAGVEVEEEGGDSTETEGPRNLMLPPILPVDLPEELRELPPLLATAELSRLRDLSLPEIQERLDAFLSLEDPTKWASLAESDEVLEPVSLEEMIAEASASLRQWEERRVLSEDFGSFFIRAELERLPASQRADVLLAAMGRYLHDRELLGDSESVDELRRRLAARMVTHCRHDGRAGDLVLSACTEETALSILLVAALRDAGVPIPRRAQLGVQAFADRFEAVLYAQEAQQVYSLTRGEAVEGVVAPIYHPATFYYGYLLDHGVVPEIDVDEHLLIALPDRPMPEAEVEMDCAVSGSVVDRAVGWIGSLLGVRRAQSGCGRGGSEGGAQSEGGISIDASIPVPRSPLQGGGGGSTGGMSGGGGGSGGGDPLAGAGPSDPTGGGGVRSGGEPGGAGSEGRSAGAGDPEAKGDGAGSGGAGQGAGTPEGTASSTDATPGASSERDGAGEAAGGRGASAAAEGDADSSGTGGTGGFGVGNVAVPAGPDLRAIGEQATELSTRKPSSADRRVVPWRLREDEGMASGSATRVMYADNQRALDRFDADDLFLTLTPAEVEVQRRMLEADQHPIYQAETTCDALGLPPRRVFRRTAAGERGFRYVFCTEQESMVVFRNQSDATSYAALSPPDRPLYLSRLATQRLASFEASEEVRRLRAFLEDPNMLRDLSKDEMFEMAKAAGDLVVFQNAIESALVQSMIELGETEVRGYYYDLHRQVLQAPLFQELAAAVDRLNRRLASDPLQSLAWANAQPELARQGFFDLYHRVGRMMEWPQRWAELQQRYGADPGPGPVDDPTAPSLDFLHVMSDPTRVRVDWTGERTGDPSIRDRHFMEGAAHSPIERENPTLAEDPDLQEETEHRRGGTGGLGAAGEGLSFGPDEGQRPLQMIHIRITPDDGDPDRQRFPEDNQIRPGGTEGGERTQTEESATRQEPVLWLSPTTFTQAILSSWDMAALEPASAERLPPVLRFNERLREFYLRELHPEGVYDNRLRAAMEVFTANGWLDYAEVREAMGGEWRVVHATDTGRFSAAYSGNPPINDEAQIRIPNFFREKGTVIPADLFPPVREHYTRAILGIFDLSGEGRVPAPRSLRSLPLAPGEESAAARERLYQALEIVREQAGEY